MTIFAGLAKRRAAMVVGDFDYTNNGQPLTALPAILTALNATYTRNSAKNVVQNGALVALSANQFGTSYDPVTGLYGYVPEPAATNLATNSDGNVATYGSTTAVSDGTAVPGFTNGIAFGDNSVNRTAYKLITGTAGVVYSVSVFVIMDDGGAPVVGSSFVSGDMRIMADGYGTTAGVTRYIGGGVYRITASFTALTGGSRGYGVTKQTTQSARTFRITGIQVETGLRATSYIATAGSTASRSADALTVPLWVNNVKDSQDGSTANWSRSNCTCVTSGTAPDGTATAQLLTTSSTATTTFYNASCRAPARTIAATVYLKKGNTTSAELRVRNDTTSTILSSATVDLDAGTVSGTGWTISNEGSGWYRCKYTVASGITVGDTLRLYVAHVGNTSTNGNAYYFWGAQIEPGSVATTYRPTTSTLESAANANITGYNSAGYTLAVDQRMDTVLAAATASVELSDGTSANRAYLAAGSGVNAQIVSASASAAQVSTVFGALGLTRKKYAASFALNSAKCALAGVAGTEDTSCLMPVGLTTLHLGHVYNATSQYNGFVFNAKLIPTPLTQAQLNGLTT